MAVGGGFTDEERDHIWHTWPASRGRVLTITGKGRFDSGALRHPNFKGFRDDKRAEECCIDLPRPSDQV
jgi:ATP-dependent DNA ligase